MTRAAFLLFTTAALLGGIPLCVAAPAAVTVDGNQASAERQVLAFAETGLPEQISVRAAAGELPLELRQKEEAEPTAQQLQWIGRGPRLVNPIRLQALVEENWVEADVGTAAKLALDGATAQCRSELTVGPYAVTLSSAYRPDGELSVQIVAEGGKPDSRLRLLIEPREPVDLACPNLPDKAPGAVPHDELSAFLPTTEGPVWDSAERMPDGVAQLFVGSADVGFSWLGVGLPDLPDEVSRTLLVRDDVGRLHWQTTLLTGPGGEASFALRIHPLQARPVDARRTAWLGWPADLPPLPFPVAGPTLFRTGADPAIPSRTEFPGYLAFAPYADFAELRGNACADMLSRQKDAIALYPITLFRALAGGPSGLTVRLRPNARDLIGEYEPPLDRQMLGRALLHDIGVAMNGIAQPAEFLRVAAALREFGYFQDDGLTECIPYWRVRGIARYGPPFDPCSRFNLTEENPAARTYVTVYRRPYHAGKKTGVQVLFVVVNERTEPVRHRLSVLDVERLFGKARARPNGRRILANLDYGKVPPDSDWSRHRVTQHRVYHKPGLLDLETRGFVQAASNKGQDAEIYGPLHVPARNVRLVWAYGLPGR